MKNSRISSNAIIVFVSLCFYIFNVSHAWSQHQQRRQFMSDLLTTTGPASVVAASLLLPSIAIAATDQAIPQSQPQPQPQPQSQSPPPIFTQGFGKEEYTNSITASRDTNISPKEVYDSIQSSYVKEPLERAIQQKRIPRAWDVGAGAGVSTQTLYNMGYQQIEACDWSSSAWDDNVVEENVPSQVHFTPVDDERFVQNIWRPNKMEKFDVIVFNFGINDRKARAYAREMLVDDGRLFAPVNVQNDYWLKQAFKVYDNQGNILWSVNDVGAWSVQFQPDVTADTCQGIWCAQYNGFKKKK
jgi:hypothetical protein